MDRKWMLVAAIVVIAMLIFALEPEDFVIGTYSYYRSTFGSIHNNSGLPSVYAAEIADLMRSADYNTIMEMYTSNTASPSQYAVFCERGIKPIVYDDRIAIPSFFNDVEFQAEYMTPRMPGSGLMPDDWPEEMKWYRISNGFNSDIATYTYNDLTDGSKSYQRHLAGSGAGLAVGHYENPWPWTDSDADKVLFGQISTLTGALGGTVQSQTYKITFKMRVDIPIDLQPDISWNDLVADHGDLPICNVGAQVLLVNSGVYNYANIPITGTLGSDIANSEEKLITVEDWDYLLQNTTPDQGFVEFEFETGLYSDIQSYIASTYPGYGIWTDHGGYEFNLCPTVYFNDSAVNIGTVDDPNIVPVLDLAIDYIAITDDLKEDLDAADGTFADLVASTSNEYGGDVWFTSKDEPMPAQWKSMDRISGLLAGDRSLFTSVLSRNLKASVYQASTNQSGVTNTSEINLLNKAYMTVSSPENYQPQFYPIDAKLSSENDNQFVQNWVDATDIDQTTNWNAWKTLQGRLSVMCATYK